MRRSVVAVLALAACQSAGPVRGAVPDAATCQAERARFAIGRPRSPRRGEQARRRAGAATVRFLAPGEIVTMEYRADRLTPTLGDGGRVVRATCG